MVFGWVVKIIDGASLTVLDWSVGCVLSTANKHLFDALDVPTFSDDRTDGFY